MVKFALGLVLGIIAVVVSFGIWILYQITLID